MVVYDGYDADVRIDNNVLTLAKKGLPAKVLGNPEPRRIPFEALAGVNFKDATRLVNGYLQVVVGSETPGKAVSSDLNTVLFRHKSRAQFAALRDHLLEVAKRNQEVGLDPAAASYSPAAKTRFELFQERQAARANEAKAEMEATKVRLEAAKTRFEELPKLKDYIAAREDAAYLKRREHLVNQLGGPSVAREDIVEAAASMRWRLGGGREIKKLVEYLQPGETVRKIGQGTYCGDQGIVVLTGSRLLLLFHGFARKAHEDFPISAISSVSTKSGMRTGDLKVFVSGNEAVISGIINEDLDPLASALREEISRVRNKGHQSTPAVSPEPTGEANPGTDPLDQIARLAELRNQGILSSEEFEAKKAELLRRL